MVLRENLLNTKSLNIFRIFAISLALAVAAIVSLTATASAYTYTTGNTWFSDGTRSKSGVSGSSVSAYAVGAVPNTPYKLVSGRNGCTTDIIPINSNTVYPNSSGIIGRVTGTINRTPGVYDVCFYGQTSGSQVTFITTPITFTVTPLVAGNTWFSDGTRSKSGVSGSTVSAYAVSAVPNTPYRLVSGRNGCTTDIVPINSTTVYAGSNGVIGKVTGTINRTPGVYDVCFYSVAASAEGSFVTAPVTFTVN